MKNNFKKILNELSYRVSSGIPDLTNEQHLMKLWEILKEHNWNVDARVELLKNLNELDFKNKEDLAKYASKHKIRPTTPVNVAGKKTTAGDELPDLKDDFDEEDYIYDEKSTNSEGVSESVSLQTEDEFSDNELKLKALEYGYGTTEKDGKILFKAAPGSDTSMFNEIISGEVTSIIQENPDLTDKEIKAILEERYGDLKGFKKGKNKIKETIAAGRNKHKQMNDGVDLLNEQIDPDTGKETLGKDVTM
jgi:transposase